MLRELIASTKKNLLRLLRSKVSAAAILAGPLALIIIIGLAFGNTKLQGINVATYADEKSEYVDNIMQRLQTDDGAFIVSEYEGEEECIQSVKEGTSHICTTFMKKSSGRTEVAFHVDYSRLSLVLVLINAMNQHISNEASEIGSDISKSLLAQMQSVNQYVRENDRRLANLSNESHAMLQGIRKIRSDVSSLDVNSSFDATALEDISDQAALQKTAIERQQESVEKEISSSKAQLVQTKKEIENTKNDLDNSQAKLEQAVQQLEASEMAMQCGSVQVEDLSRYMDDSAGLELRLREIARPECSVMFTARKNMNDMLSQSEEVERKLDLAYAQLVQAEDRLESFESEYEEGSEIAIEQIDAAQIGLAAMSRQVQAGNAKAAEIRGMQQSLATQLSDAERSINASTGSLQALHEGINEVKESLAGVESVTPEAIVKPFDTSIKSVTGARRQFDFLFPSLLMLVIMFVSILAASTIVMKEKASRAYFRNLILPSSAPTIFTSVLMTSALLSFIQLFVILSIGMLLFDISISSPLLLLLGSLLAIVCFSLVGMVFGFLFSSEETTTLVSIMTAVVLFLFSSVIIPMESMSAALVPFAKVNPFVLSETLLRQALLFDSGFGASFWILLLETVGLLLVALFTIYRTRKHV